MKTIVIDLYQTPPRITDRLFSRPQRWRWRALAGNNRVIANSGEGFVNYQDAYDSALILVDPAVRVALPNGDVIRMGSTES